MKNRVYNFPPASGVPGTSQAAQASEAFPTSEVSQTRQAFRSLQAAYASTAPQILQLSRRLRLSGLMLLAIIGGTALNVSGQEESIADFPDNAIMAPDTRSSMKYGSNSLVDMYTGAVNVSIPVYTYKDNDFEIPISFKYASQGFVPNMPVGPLGAAWFLSVGGVITREVNGIPDEYWRMWGSNEDGWKTSDDSEWYKDKWRDPYKNPEPPYFGYGIHEEQGYYFYHRLHKNGYSGSADTPALTYVRRINHRMLSYVLQNNTRVETSPDVFSFNFMGHRGKFHMSGGDVVVYETSDPNGEYEVDLSGFGYYIEDTTKRSVNEISEIIIKTGDGYSYTFSGLYQHERNKTGYAYTNFSSLYNDERDVAFLEKEIYREWKLTKITSPNGNEVNLEYYRVGYSVVAPIADKYEATQRYYKDSNKDFHWKLDDVSYLPSRSVPEGYDRARTWGGISSGVATYKYQTSRLKSIKIGSSLINFHYNPKEISETGAYAVGFDYDPNAKPEPEHKPGSGINPWDPCKSVLLYEPVGFVGENDKGQEVLDYTALNSAKNISNGVFSIQIGNELKKSTYDVALKSMKNKFPGELSKITVSYDNKLVKTIDLQYDSLGTGVQKKRFLKGVTIPGTGTYKMRYFTGDFPVNGIPSVDYWGFLNGNQWDQDGLLDVKDIGKNSVLGEPLDLGRRTPNPNWAHLGMLSTIVYPTGGSSVFEYEPNEASTYVSRDMRQNSGYPTQKPYVVKLRVRVNNREISNPNNQINLYRPEVYRDSLSHCVGGLRVKRVITYRQPFNADGTTSYQLNASGDSINNSDYTVKEYTYEKGNVLSFPEYQMYYRTVKIHLRYSQYPEEHWHYYKEQGVSAVWNPPHGEIRGKFTTEDYQEFIAWMNSPNAVEPDPTKISIVGEKMTRPLDLPIYSDKTHIEYGRVTEKSSDGSYKVYNFTTYSDIKDRVPQNIYSIPPHLRTVFPKEGSLLDYKERPIYDSIPRSNVDNFLKKPISKAFLRGKLKKVESYDATGTLVAAEYYKPSTDPLKYTKEWACADIFAYETIRYADNYKLGSKTESQYFTNPSGRRDSLSVTTSYSYNDLGQVNEIKRTHTDGTTEKTTVNYLSSTTAESSSESLMVEDNMRKFPKSVYKYIDNPVLSGAGYKLVEGAKYKYSGGKPSSVYKVVSGSPDKEILEESYLYDGIGRPIQKTDKKGIRTSYVWGYKGMYPVAVIEDAPYYSSITRAIIGTTILNAGPNFDLDEGLEPNQEAALRNMTQGRVTTYKYDPLVGMTEMTDPVGRKIFYMYDKYGRLEFVKDEDGNILNKYKYSPMNDWLLFPYLRPFGDSSYVLKPGQVLDFYGTYSNDKVMSIISNEN